MSWFKKLFSSQGSCSSQTPAVKFIKVTQKKDDEDDIKKKEPDTNNESEQSTQEIDQTQESSCYNWSGATSLFNSQGEKRKWVNYEETENLGGNHLNPNLQHRHLKNLGGNHLNHNCQHKNQHKNQLKLATLS